MEAIVTETRQTAMTCTSERAGRFADLMRDGMNAIVRACEVYAEEVSMSDDEGKAFRALFPSIDAETWTTFEMVGTGAWDERMIDIPGGMACTAMRRLPRSAQATVFDDGVDLLVSDGKGGYSPLKVRLRALSRNQVYQAFAENHIRSLGEQRAWIEARKEEVPEVKPVSTDTTVEPTAKGLLIRLGDRSEVVPWNTVRRWELEYAK